MDAVEYFRWMTPLAGRISSDIELTRCAYQDLWNGLSQSEKDQVIDEAIIDPAIVLKYNSLNQNGGRIKPISKFSWFTKSQLDLFNENIKETERSEPVVKKKGPAPEPPNRESSLVTASNNVPTAPTQPLRVIVPSPVSAMRSKRAIIASPPSEPNNLFGRLKNRQRCDDRQRSDDRQPLVPIETSVSIIKTKQTETSLHPTTHPTSRVAKPKTPPPPPPTSSTPAESLTLLSHDEVDSIPKTGFDFLDNW